MKYLKAPFEASTEQRKEQAGEQTGEEEVELGKRGRAREREAADGGET